VSDSIIITPSLGDAVISSSEDARFIRDDLLKEAALVTTVADRLDADAATSTLRALKAYQTAIETARTKAKAPALEVGRKIDALAKDLSAKVVEESARISRVLGAFEAEERRKADDARIAAENEAARIAREAEAAAIQARRGAKTAEAADRASDAILEKAAEQTVAVRQQAVNAVAPKQAGTAIRTDYAFEVTDIKALYAAHPELVTLEPNGAAIRAILRANPNLQIPGLRSWAETKLNVR
jgi:hypothetical protein